MHCTPADDGPFHINHKTADYFLDKTNDGVPSVDEYLMAIDE